MKLAEWLDSHADRLTVTEKWEKLAPAELLTELASSLLLPDPALLTRLWEGVSAPRTCSFLHFLYQRSRTYHREQVEAQVDDERIHRSLLGMVSGAQVVRALLTKDEERLRHWVPISLAAWSGAEIPTVSALHSPPATVSEASLDAWYTLYGQAAGAQTGLAGAWARELFRTCRRLRSAGQPSGPSPERPYRRTPVLIYQPSGAGLVCWLVVVLDDPAGDELYPDPVHLALQPMTCEFLAAVDAAWQAARATSGRSGAVRWRIEGNALTDGGKLVLEGASHGAALGIALTQLLRGDLLDPRLGITATLSADGLLGPVAGVTRKADAAFQLRDLHGKPLVTRILVHPQNGPEARAAAANATGSAQESVVLADTLTAALEEAGGTLPDLRRLLAGEMTQILTEAARSLQRPFPTWTSLRGFHVPVRVARLRRSGLLDSAELAGSREDHGEEWESGATVRVEAPWQALRQETHRAILLGAPGFGKTMLLWQEVGLRCQAAWEHLRKQGDPETINLAVFFRAGELGRALQQDPDLLSAAATLLIERHDLADTFHTFLRNGLEQGNCLLVVDALDDCADEVRALLQSALRGACERHPGVSFLLSSRREGYVRLGLLALEDELEILPFDEEQQIDQAIHNWFHDRAQVGAELTRMVREQRHLRHIFRSPLLLRIACEIVAAAGTAGKQLPRWERRVELYRLFLRNLTLRWALRPPHPSLAQRDLFLPMAGEFSLELLRQDLAQSTLGPASAPEFTGSSRFAATVNEIQRDYPAMSGRQFLDDLCAAGILVNVGEDRLNPSFAFAHRTFQEFLAASCLAEQANRQGWGVIEPELDACAHLPAWQEVIVFVAGMLQQPVPLLRLLADPRRDDRLRHRLALAARCLTEIELGATRSGGTA